MRNNPLAIASLLLLPTFLAGCSGGRHEPTEKYYLVAANIKVPYWQAANSGLVRAAKELGVQAEMVGPDTHEPAAEQEQFRKAVAKKPAGILVSPADANLLKADIDSALAQGIPVITMDSDAPGSKRLTFIGTNNYEAGMNGGKVLVQQLKGKGNVVVFTMPGQANLEERLHGYRDVIGNNPGVKITRVVDMRGDSRIAFDTTNDITTKNASSVDAFVCLEALSCKEVAEVLSRKRVTGKVIVAMDTDKDTLDWIQKGGIAATIAQKPFTMAFYGVKILDDLHHYKPAKLDAGFVQDPFAPVPYFVDTGATLIDKSNLDQFRRLRQDATSDK
jgi:ribose transport system substrate-binding protein